MLKGIEISLPPLPIQRRIASVLSACDDVIENNTRRIRILEAMAQRLYREWSINFRFPGGIGPNSGLTIRTLSWYTGVPGCAGRLIWPTPRRKAGA